MQKEIQIKKVIVWGHPLHSHTHSYIHNAFYTAFKELGYETHWFHDNMNTDHVDFSNSLLHLTRKNPIIINICSN